jgi:hypothetical protein
LRAAAALLLAGALAGVALGWCVAEPWKAPWAIVLVIALGQSACTEGLRGAPMEAPPETGSIVATASAGEPHGLRVLWNGRTSGGDFGRKAWVAGSADELAAVWSSAAVGEAPFVDFREYVVLAFAGEGSVCNPRIVGIDAEASGRLTLRSDPADGIMTCILVAVRVAQVIAVPRRILPATVVFLGGYAFAVPEVPFG